ncbi:hypothetical protein GQ457_12G022250 [Hibiscus cannabinus]
MRSKPLIQKRDHDDEATAKEATNPYHKSRKNNIHHEREHERPSTDHPSNQSNHEQRRGSTLFLAQAGSGLELIRREQTTLSNGIGRITENMKGLRKKKKNLP